MRLCSTLLLLLPIFTFLPPLSLQSQDTLPQITPISIQPLTGENDPTEYCYSNLVFDTTGRLWMKTCGVAEQLYDLQVLQFDGYARWPLNVSKEKWKDFRVGFLEGISAKGFLYGYLNQLNDQSTLYTYDVATNTLVYTPLPNGIVGGIEEYEPGKFWVLGKTKTAFNIYRWDGKTLKLQLPILSPTHYNEEKERFLKEVNSNFITVGNTLWLLDKELPLMGIHLPSQSIEQYTIVDFPPYVERELPKEDIFNGKVNMVIRDSQVYVVHTLIGDQFYHMNWKEGAQKFSVLPVLPEGTQAQSIWKDKQGNLLLIFQYLGEKEDTYGAYLLDSSNELFDYSPMIESMPFIHHVSGNDFRKQVYLGTATGAFLVQALRKNTISIYKQMKGLRHIRQIGEDKFLIIRQGHGLLLLEAGKLSKVDSESCIGKGPELRGKKGLVTDPDGKVWVKDWYSLIRATPNTDGSCLYHSFDFKIWSAAFAGANKVVLIKVDDNQLMLYDLQNRESIDISDRPIQFQGIVHQIYVDENNILWVATSQGLYKVDLSSGDVRQFGDTDDFEDNRILVIHDDGQGRLWLGTVNRGIHIFDIQKEKVVEVIDESDGLSNNVVVGMLEDEDGVIWAATYNGLTLIRANGEIITVLTEKDGLSYNEFNRYAYHKRGDGKFMFGALNGLNIVDPQNVKQALAASETTKIFVSRLSYFDTGKERIVHLRNYHNQQDKLVLPADKRFLSVSVGMSNYGLNVQNRYAYQLEGLDEDWTYMGTEHFIRLPNLPAGKYNLLIAGIDQNGNWSSNTIRIPIYGKEFFYKQAWFYILLAMPFLVFALIWIRRLRKEKDILEKEVDKRTLQIRKDKALIEQQASELKQLDKMKSRFFANISHDFRTPLTLITGPAELLEENESVPKVPLVRQSINAILQNGKKLLNLVDEMMDLAKIESHQIKLNEEKVALQIFCKNLFSSYQAAAKRKNIQFELQYQMPANYSLLTDPRRLEKILNNLLGNAFKFTEEKGSIYFSIYSNEQKAHFEVKDTGRGIPKEDLPYIFDRYFQSKQEALTKSTGSGIGLSLSQELAKLMGGYIKVLSKFGVGSTFTLSLPAKEGGDLHNVLTNTNHVIHDTETHEQLVPKVSNQNASTVLVVEDNLEVQNFLKSLLQEDYKVVTKDNGLEALNYLTKNQPNLILSDINMPKMNGYELLAAIKTDEKLQAIPVIMLTAKIREKNKLQALRMGVDDYLTKPFSPTELLLRIHNLLDNYQKRRDFQKEYYKVEPQFESSVSVDQSWLEELEKVTLDALDKRLDLTIPYLANTMAISQRQLSRKIKLLTGLTVGKYIQEVKLQKARHLLENRNIASVAEAAYNSGFKSPSHFNKIYFKYYGKNPSSYL